MDPPGSPSRSDRTSDRIKASVGLFWDDRRLGIAAALGLAVAWGLVAAWFTPRGPLTTSEALWSMMISVAVGGMAGGRAVLFDEWYPMIDAPIKELAVLDTSGHRPLFEQPDRFVDFMVDTVLARTSPSAMVSR